MADFRINETLERGEVRNLASGGGGFASIKLTAGGFPHLVGGTENLKFRKTG